MRLKNLSFLGCFFLSHFLAAQKFLVLKDGFNYAAASVTYTFEDTANRIINPFSAEFKKIEIRDLELNYTQNTNSTYWKKIVVVNHSSDPTWLLEFPDPHIGKLKLFTLIDHKYKEYKEVGFNYPFFNRPVVHKNYSFPLYINPGDTAVCFARISSDTYCGLTAKFRSLSNFTSYFFNEYYFLGLYYGIIMMLVVYNAFLAFYSKESIYLYYCLYTISCALFTYSEDGLAFEFLWPSYPRLNYFLERLSPVFLLVSFLFYSGRLINISSRQKNFQYMILASSLLYIVCHLLLKDNYHLRSILYIFPFAFTFYSALKIFRNGYSAARFFLIGNSVILVSFVVFFLRAKGWIVSNAFTVYLFNYGFVFEAIVFSIALADKLKMVKEEKDSARSEIIRQLEINEKLQQKVNAELETKVQERTKELKDRSSELEIANYKLEKLKSELYEMNSKMDINIWELKNEVKREMEARFLNDTISYHEFAEIFPETKCYQYLKELKWKDGFVCPKCANPKSGRGNSNFTFKCTQCQYQESVTSNTLFHGVKFPISKAFYLAYYLMKNGNDVSYEELSQIVGLTKNTVWKFGKRVNAGIKMISTKNKSAGNWKKLVLSTPLE